jgi:Family of unknown function (DUF5670)
VPCVHPGDFAIPAQPSKVFAIMLNAIAVALILLWLVGLVSAYTMNGFIHVLLVIAILLLLLGIIRGKRTG